MRNTYVGLDGLLEMLEDAWAHHKVVRLSSEDAGNLAIYIKELKTTIELRKITKRAKKPHTALKRVK